MRSPRQLGPRVVVVGPPGSGKTTVAVRVAEALRAPWCQLDLIFWRPDWSREDPNSCRKQLRDFIGAPRWVIDGNYFAQSSDITWSAAETIVWLDLPRRTTVRRVIVRTGKGLLRGGLSLDTRRARRRSLIWLRHAWRDHPRYRREYEEALEGRHWPHLTWIRLRSSRSVRSWLRDLEDRPMAGGSD